MKKTILLTLAALSLNASALAQSNTSTASTDAAASSSAPQLKISYTGIAAGPEADFAKAKLPGLEDDLFISNRFKFAAAFGKNFDTGLQVRVRTTNTTAASNGITNENWRLFANVKNMFKNDVASFTLTPRVVLPTSNSAHKQNMLPSPELIATLDIAPKNSKLAFSIAPQFIKQMYHSNIAGAGKQEFYAILNLESTYAISDTTQVTMGFYPEFVNNRNAPMVNTSDCVDLGMNFDIAKGWSLNPYFETEMLNMDPAVLKSSSINLVLNGSFL